MKIEFTPTNKDVENIILPPTPAIKNLPDWWKKMSSYIDKDGGTGPLKLNYKVKKCVPFMDAISAGYFITLHCDVIVRKNEDKYEFAWTSRIHPILLDHLQEQINGYPVPTGFNSFPYKWTNEWAIKTTPGYSLLVTHPMNRSDLPFHTMSGIVDTDKYNSPIQLPFLIREDFVGKISAGTPIAQIIPIKNSSWKSKINSYTKFDEYSIEKLFNYAENGYRKIFWKRKKYE